MSKKNHNSKSNIKWYLYCASVAGLLSFATIGMPIILYKYAGLHTKNSIVKLGFSLGTSSLIVDIASDYFRHKIERGYYKYAFDDVQQ